MRLEPIALSIIGMLLLLSAIVMAFRDVVPIGGKIFAFVLPLLIIYSAFQIDRLQRRNKKP